MKCFESPSGLRDPMMWHKRQSIRDFVKKNEFDEALKKIKALEIYVKLTKEEFEDEGI